MTTYGLALPWLDVVVWAQSGNDAAAQRLLSTVRQRKQSGMGVPRQAGSVFIQSLAGRDGDGLQRNATVRRTEDVNQLLQDLRSLRTTSAARHACDGQWWPHTALLTVRSGSTSRTFAARFDACGLVISGSGLAARSTPQLLRDVRWLVPNSGL